MHPTRRRACPQSSSKAHREDRQPPTALSHHAAVLEPGKLVSSGAELAQIGGHTGPKPAPTNKPWTSTTHRGTPCLEHNLLNPRCAFAPTKLHRHREPKPSTLKRHAGPHVCLQNERSEWTDSRQWSSAMGLRSQQTCMPRWRWHWQMHRLPMKSRLYPHLTP